MRNQHNITPGLTQVTRLRAIDAPETRSPDYSKWQALFLPRREAYMADELNRQSGLFIPYPLLAIILTLVLGLGSGIIGLFIQVNSLQTTLLLRDADHKEAIKKLDNAKELHDQYIRDIRERQAEMRSDVNQLLKKRGG